ncbi:lasso peptide biosynthesis B2 protein [Pedobacter changchengzhani]|uniref:Lasso peptide biosynthesis B2 protein n=1 Tax=Pedobacter changchengzhani TaxID=2529274 RepID=A0A4R5MQV2_9SPHI|nr:lasso peptide biosynthesis B2 protein [Pedobacter changchengzhani]TDG37689.1 lasso peptide biosynthesis B2 protein [Pedobacter changchengzhani]
MIINKQSIFLLKTTSISVTNSFIKNFKEKFILVSNRDKLYYAEIFFLAAWIRFCIYFFPFKFYKNTLGKLQEEAVQEISTEAMAFALNIKNIVLTVCNHTPWESKCLVQAIICKKILKRSGIKSTIYLGVKNDNNKKLLAHAWLKFGDKILTGGAGHKEFNVVNFYG